VQLPNKFPEPRPYYHLAQQLNAYSLLLHTLPASPTLRSTRSPPPYPLIAALSTLAAGCQQSSLALIEP
jgi:hypothetical protein